MPSQAKPGLLGITSTIPVEIALAAGWSPVDLNNRFITHPDPESLVQRAEDLGLPRTLCAWIKGMYAWCLEHPEVAAILGVTQGDCSNTHALLELLGKAGRRVMGFGYAPARDADDLQRQMLALAHTLGAGLDQAEEVRRELEPLRRDLARLDRMTWQDGLVNGAENHLWLVSASDFDGDPHDFQQRLTTFLEQAGRRQPLAHQVRLGLLGVPPIMSGLHEAAQGMGAAIVYNEVPRQFAMLPEPEPVGLVEQYLRYTYPYDVFGRVTDIQAQVKRRGLDGLIHYTQTFCWRQMQDLILRAELGVPMLTLEGDKVGPLDGRSRLRLEAFIEMLS